MKFLHSQVLCFTHTYHVLKTCLTHGYMVWCKVHSFINLYLHYEKRCFVTSFVAQFLNCNDHLQLMAFLHYECYRISCMNYNSYNSPYIQCRFFRQCIKANLPWGCRPLVSFKGWTRCRKKEFETLTSMPTSQGN